MGAAWSRVLGVIAGPQKIVMVGLDAAGKTTLLYRLKLGDTTQTIPTIGFNVERITIGTLDCIVWDIGGQSKLRQLWSHYLAGANMLLFVVDSHDRDRLQMAADELKRMMSEPALAEAAILVFANKQDLPNAATCAELTDVLFGGTCNQQRWRVQACCASTGDGVDAGMRWVTETLFARRSALSTFRFW